MSFAHWTWLIGLFAPACLLVWIWLRDRFPELKLGSDRRLVLPQDAGLAARGLFWNFLLRVILCAGPLALAAAILLLAGPRHLSVPKEERELTNIEFCLDLSGSMMGRFGSGTRYDAAMQAINDFVDSRPGDAFGLTVFGDKAEHWIPLTTDPSAFRCAVPFLNPRRLPPGYGGGTMIGKGLKKCQSVLITRQTGDRMIILVSDGASFDLGSGQEEEIGRSLREDNIVVYSIHIGPGNSPPEVAAVTNITGGKSFNPQDAQSLNSVFRQIDQMEVAQLKRTYAELVDWFFPFASTGLGFLGLAMLGVLGLRYTPW